MNIRSDLPVYLIRDRNPLALLPAIERYNLFKEYIKLFGIKEPVRELAVKFATNPKTVTSWKELYEKGLYKTQTPESTQFDLPEEF